MRFSLETNMLSVLAVLVTCFGCAYALSDLQTDDYKQKYFTPQIQIIEPDMRKGSPGKSADIAPCGGISSPGTSNFIASPDTHGFIKWKTINPDFEGM